MGYIIYLIIIKGIIKRESDPSPKWGGGFKNKYSD